MTVSERDELAHADAATEEWTFSWWDARSLVGGYTSYRLRRDASSWYCWGWWRDGHPLLHIVEFDIPRRADPMIAKAEAMWAEYTCEAPMEQWTFGNETHAVELDDPAEALGRVHGTVVPIASDIEWYAEGAATDIADGYLQHGVVLGEVETVDGRIVIDETRSIRTHRWSSNELSAAWMPEARAHLGPRIPFAYPNGTSLDLVMTPDGWCRRD
ncbi:MAG: hypothetical protein RLZZ368_603 [Actinomycetota bacterium]|jgi:hypothetical protein